MARHRQVPIERLETRRLLSLTIDGTDSADSFVIGVEDDDTIHLTFNGGVEVLNPPSDSFVDVRGLGGNDDIWLQNTGTLKFTLSGFAGDDHFHVGNGQLEVDVRRDVHIVELPPQPNHGGTDTILIDDSISNDTGTTYGLDGSELFLLSTLSQSVITWIKGPEDSVTIQGSREADELIVASMDQNLLFDLGGGNDNVTISDNHSVDPNLPDNSTIRAGSGNDFILLDDTSTTSPRDDFEIDDTGLRGATNLEGFVRMHILTHRLADGSGEFVGFRGESCPAPLVTVTGSNGPDFVQIGEPFNGAGVFGPLYVDTIFLDLPGTNSTVQFWERPAQSGHSWTFDDNGLHSATGSTKITAPPTANINFTFEGTQLDDIFTVDDVPATWNVTVDGNDGNDKLQTSIKRDLDDIFDGGRFVYEGGNGSDTLTLDDSADQTGDSDTYEIAFDRIFKHDANLTLSEFLVEYHFVDQLVLACDEDPNLIHYDVASFGTVDIFGLGGDDSFIDVESTTQQHLFVNSLAPLTRLHGGTGSNHLILDDTNGGAGDYRIDVDSFHYNDGAHAPQVQFDNFASVDVVGSNQANTAQIDSKLPTVTMSFVGSGGDDQFLVGGGDIDSSGLNGITLGGSAGNDSIKFDDRFDNHDGAFDADTLTLEFQRLIKGGVNILYGSFESQQLLTSGKNTGTLAFPNTIMVNAISIPTEVFTTAGVRDNLVDVGAGPFGLSQVGFGVLSIIPSAPTTLQVNDPASTVNKSFHVTATQVTETNGSPPLTINHGGCDTINILAGITNDQVFVDAVNPGDNVFVSGGNGDDTVTVGNGRFSNIHGRVDFQAGSGSADRIIYTNALDTGPTTGTLAGNSFTAGGLTHQFFGGTDTVEVMAGSGGSDINVDSTITATIIDGGTGADHVDVGAGNYSVNILGSVTFNAGAGDDSILFDDASSTGNDAYQFANSNQFAKAAPAGITSTNSVDHKTLEAGSGNNTINVLLASLDLHINANAGNDTVNVADLAAGGTVTVNTGSENTATSPFGDTLVVNSDSGSGDAPVTVNVDRDDAVRTLNVFPGGTLKIAPGAVLNKQSGGQFSNLGLIDLAGGALMGSLSSAVVRLELVRGFNGGSWNGTNNQGAINSSLAAGSALLDGVGYGSGSQIAITSIGSFPIAAGDVVVRYTLAADANLDAAVDVSDLGILATNWQGTGKVFALADFNYDGATDVTDLGMLATDWQLSLPSAGSSALRTRIVRERAEESRSLAVSLIE